MEVNVEVNSVTTSDDITITNDHYSLPPHPPTQVFILRKAKVKQLKALLMSSGKPTCRKNDALLENLKELIGDAKTFTVEYSSELVDSTVVTNEANQIQNDVPPIALVVMTGEDQFIVEDVTYDFLNVPTCKIYQYRRICVSFKVCYIFVNKY